MFWVFLFLFCIFYSFFVSQCFEASIWTFVLLLSFFFLKIFASLDFSKVQRFVSKARWHHCFLWNAFYSTMLTMFLFIFLFDHSLERTLMVPEARYGSSVPQWRAAHPRHHPLHLPLHLHPAPHQRRGFHGGRFIRWSQLHRTSRRRPIG